MKNKRIYWAMLFVGLLWINQISCGGGGGSDGGSSAGSSSQGTSLLGTWDRVAVSGTHSTNLAVQITFINTTSDSSDTILGNCSWKTSDGAFNNTFIYYKDPFHITGTTLTSVISGLAGTVTVTWINNDTVIFSWASGNSEWVRR